ncbi:MAG: hypothetical protein FD180_4468 [Planctomycetota bacterium]|nr:MAG: hypothetical protein FD180_4468 [Planctomycetota bacterium]
MKRAMEEVLVWPFDSLRSIQPERAKRVEGLRASLEVYL